MTRKIDLADPDLEPTDEELEGLMKRAFAGIRERRERERRAFLERMAAVHEQIRRELEPT